MTNELPEDCGYLPSSAACEACPRPRSGDGFARVSNPGFWQWAGGAACLRLDRDVGLEECRTFKKGFALSNLVNLGSCIRLMSCL